MCNDLKKIEVFEVYEVIRVMNGKTVFPDEHISRLERSLAHYADFQIDRSALITGIKNVIAQRTKSADTYGAFNFNIRIGINENAKVSIIDVDGVYPTRLQMENGVSLKTYEFKRKNPNVKYMDVSQREEISKIRKKAGAFQMLYVHDQKIYECERANIFFIKNGTCGACAEIITAPDEAVLLGVTREKVLEAAELCGINISKRFISIAELGEISAAAVSGTSLNLLPVNQIDDVDFDVNDAALAKLIKAFSDILVIGTK